MINKLFSRITRVSKKQLMVAGAFALAVTASMGLGFATKQYSQAATIRECNDNAILRCGAADANEFIEDIKVMNTRDQKYQGDLTTIYSHFGLTKDKYERFKQTARHADVMRNGDVIVDGQVVMTGSESIGRQKFNSYRKEYKIGNNTYYTGSNDRSYAPGVKSISAMAMFDANGVVEAIVMNPCGNPVKGNPVKPEYSCKTLNQTKIGENKYRYTTTVGPMKNAKIKDLTYNFGDGTPTKTVTNPDEAVEHTFTKSSEVTVSVRFEVSGKKIVTAPIVINCKKKVTVEVPKTPFYNCVGLAVSVLNTKKTQFRVTVTTSQGDGATLKDADFTLDGATTTGVNTRDASGKIYKEYTVAEDGKAHKVTVKVNFNVAGGVQSKNCEASFTAGQEPKCPVPGKTHLPVDSPECAWCPVPGKEDLPKDSDKCYENCPVPGKTHLPKDSKECYESCPVEGKTHLPANSPECKEDETPPTPPTELPHTGIGGALGLFAGTSALGAAAHQIMIRRKR